MLLYRGLNLKFAFDHLDPYADVGEDASVMYRVGIEPFLTQFLQVRLFYRFRDAPPQLTAQRYDDLLLEVHGFF